MRIGLKFLVATILCAHTATVFSALPAVAQKGHGEIDFGIATNFYKNKNYQGALEHFRKSLEKGNNTAETWLYIGHCYASLGKRADAITVYKEVQRKYKGLAAERLATQSIARLGGSVVSGAAGAGSPAAASSSSPAASSAAASAQRAGQGLMNRIDVIAPTQPKHPPVSSTTLGVAKTVVSRLPRWVYSVLDEGGVSIHIGPNITDKWPEKGRQSMPGAEELTLDQEGGRTVGRDVYLWERRAYGDGDRELGEPQPAEALADELRNQLAHALDNCLGISASPEYKIAFDLDKAPISKEDKRKLDWYVHSEDPSGTEVCALVVEAQALGEREPEIVEKHFGRCKTAAKAVLDREYKRRATMKPTVAKVGQPVRPRASVATVSSGTSSSAAGSKDATLSMPAEEKIPYVRGPGGHLFVNGAVNGRPTRVLIDTGAFKVVIGKEELVALGVKPPTGASEYIGSGAAGALKGWEMELEVSIGRIKRKLPVQVFDGSQVLLLGQPFLRGMHYQIDNSANYLHFTRDQKDLQKQMSYDSVEVPFRMQDGNLMVSAKVNGKPVELNFDTGAPHNVFTQMQMYMFDIEPYAQTYIGGVGGSAVVGYRARVDSMELGPIKKTNVECLISPAIGHGLVGQEFFGHMRYVIDNEKHVIRFAR